VHAFALGAVPRLADEGLDVVAIREAVERSLIDRGDAQLLEEFAALLAAGTEEGVVPLGLGSLLFVLIEVIQAAEFPRLITQDSVK
jgi:hypothetical protein